jgi:hypothetical protein
MVFASLFDGFGFVYKISLLGGRREELKFDKKCTPYLPDRLSKAYAQARRGTRAFIDSRTTK